MKNAPQDPIAFKRPTTALEVKSLQQQAYAYAMKEDYASAIALCDWLIEESSTRIAGLRVRADVYQHQNENKRAIDDLEVILSCGVDEPADMYLLGKIYLQQGLNTDSEALLKKAVKLCEQLNFEYYLNPCRILLCEALLRLDHPQLALDELQKLSPKYSTYIYGVGNRTKESMEAEAKKALHHEG